MVRERGADGLALLQLDDTTAPTRGAQPDAGETDSRSFYGGNLAERGYIVHLDEQHRFLASPSISKLPSGRLLLLYEKCADPRGTLCLRCASHS